MQCNCFILRNLYIVITLKNVKEAQKSSHNRKVNIRLMISVVAMVRQVYHGYIGYHSNQNLYIFLSFYSIPHPFHQVGDSKDNLFKKY